MRVSILNTRHPDYDRDCITRWNALYAGGETWRALSDQFVPQHPQEPADLYAIRRRRAAYVNHAGPILDLIAGMLYEDPPVVDGAPDGWVGNVDRRGASLRDWTRTRLLVAAMVGQRAYVWANLPPRVEVASLADQEAAGALTPFLVDLTAEEVHNWSEDENGALRSVLFHRCGVEQPDLLAEPQRVHRWTYIDGAVIRSWSWVAPKGRTDPLDTDDATEDPPVAHGFGRLPVVRLALGPGLHAMGKLEDPARALTATENDLDWALHRGAHPLLTIQSDDPKGVTLGAGYFLNLPMGAQAVYVEPSGSCYTALEARIKVRQEEVYRVVQQMAQSATADASKAAASAASKSMDWAAMETMLEAYAGELRTALTQLLDILAGRLPAFAGATLSGLSGWGDEDIGERLANLQLAAPMVKSPTYRREVAKRTAHALLDDADDALLATIDAEIDAADYSEEAVYVTTPGASGAANDGDGVDAENADETAAEGGKGAA